MKSVECITRVIKLPSIQRHEIGIDVATIESSAAKNNRHIDAPLVHQLKVIAHDKSRFDKQAAHPDGIGFCFFPGAKYVVYRLLDAEIYDLVAVISENDVDEILTNIVDITFHS